MGFSDAGICLSDQNNLSETDLGFLLGFSGRNVQESQQDQDLGIKLQETTNSSSHGKGVKVKKAEQEEEEDFCKTPTRPGQIIPAIPNICPPAPRKPRGVPSRSLKVRTYKSRRMIILNVSREIDSLFDPTSLGNKIKKARHI